jgi:ADP-ribosylglycohydrolase
MGKLASAYIKDMQSPTGWTMPGRAPGTTCKKAATKLKERIEWHQTHRVSLHPNWWQAGEITDGGCGSVMRAHPFGLVFADNPKKAATWAAEHSRITHGHPAAIAACAAMAIGTAYAVQGKDPEYIIEQMIAIAKQFDPVEFRDNPYTCQEEKSCWGKMEDAVKLAQAFVPGGVIPLIPFDHPAEQSIYSQKIKIFHTYLGWAADDALAAALYIFALCPDNVTDAIYLGVHTPGDSDSIASMAGALVGARVGAFELQKKHNPENYEDADILVEYAEHATRLIKQIK